MGLHYENLDAETRKLMLEELAIDVENGNLLKSNWISEQGATDWPLTLRSALETGDDNTLAAELMKNGRLNKTSLRKKPTGGFTEYKVPVTAADTIAEGEFNRYYVRAICRRALDGPNAEIEIYRGKAVEVPRPGSEAKIGLRFPAAAVLGDLRNSVGLEPSLGLPPGPNSGLTARLPKT